MTIAPLHTAEVKNDPLKIQKSARDFESLLIAQMLKGIREAKGDDSNDTAMAIAEEQLANSIANNGGLGLAKLIVKGLGRATSSPPASSGGPTSRSPAS